MCSKSSIRRLRKVRLNRLLRGRRSPRVLASWLASLRREREEPPVLARELVLLVGVEAFGLELGVEV